MGPINNSELVIVGEGCLYGLTRVQKPNSIWPLVLFNFSPTDAFAKYPHSWFKTNTNFHSYYLVHNLKELIDGIKDSNPPPKAISFSPFFLVFPSSSHWI